MTSAHDIAAALRERQPGMGAVKLQKLLYYCQGHHLAAFGTPLFGERIVAYNMGPVVEELWRYEKSHATPKGSNRILGEAELNTIGYVLSRYGGMTGIDLARLSHSESPWLRADSSRYPGTSTLIHNDWIREYFVGEGAPESSGDDEVVLDSAELAAFLAGAAERNLEPRRADDLDAIRARMARG